MAIARLPVILVLVLHFLQDYVQGQQISLVNQPNADTNCNPSVSSDPKIAELIASVKNSQCQKCANNGFNFNTATQQCNNPSQQAGLQQILNSQQLAAVPLNLQPVSSNSQPAFDAQISRTFANSQQPVTLRQCANENLIQSINLQAFNPQQSTNQNLQQQLVFQPIQQPTQQSINQPQVQNIQQQQQLSMQPQLGLIPLSNQEIVGQLAPPQREIPLSSLPIINSQVQELPSLVSQGVLLSNLGLSSSLPTLLSNSPQTSADKVSLSFSQSNVAPLNDLPVYVFDGQRNSNIAPISLSPSYSPIEYVANNPTSFTIPVNLQNTASCQPNQPVDLGLNSINFVHCQPPQQQVLVQAQPVQVQPQPAQASPCQVQYPMSIQSQPVCAMQTQQTPILSENQPSSPSSSLASMLLSQFQPSSTSSQYPNQSPNSPNQGSKSSTMKTLLPLLFNLLKEKNGGCGCPPNCNNCCCMNNKNNWQEQQVKNPCTNINNYDNLDEKPNEDFIKPDDKKYKAEPQVFDGYSNKIKYGQSKEKKELINNFVESEEVENSTKAQDDKRYQINKKKINDSLEYEEDDDYEDDEYENED